MSTAEDDDDVVSSAERPTVRALKGMDEERFCDHCRSIAPGGAVASLRVGWEYRELCGDCFHGLAETTLQTWKSLVASGKVGGSPGSSGKGGG